MDIGEIRTAFALSETLADRVRRFRDERLGRILGDETPVPLQASARVVLHMFPVAAAEIGEHMDIREAATKHGAVTPLGSDGYHSGHFNADGYLTRVFIHSETAAAAYLQVYRTGAIESVNANILRKGE